MRGLAELLIELYAKSPRAAQRPFTAGLRECTGEEYYGHGYQDMTYRRPSIEKAKTLLAWTPRYGLQETLAMTMEWFLASVQESEEALRDKSVKGLVRT